MELNGFYLDAARWREQLDRVKIAQGKVALELQQMLSAGVAQASLFGVAEINLDSQAQVTDALKNLGVPVPETTRGWQLQPLGARISGRRQTARISRRREIDVELRRKHSGIYQTANRQNSRRFSPDRRADRTFQLFETEYPADSARRSVSPLLSRARRQKIDNRRLQSDRAANFRRVFKRRKFHQSLYLRRRFPHDRRRAGFQRQTRRSHRATSVRLPNA